MNDKAATDAGGDDSHGEPQPTNGELITRSRKGKGWSQPQLAYRMIQVGARYQGAAGVQALVKMISKWENDHIEPNEYNRRLLIMALDTTAGDLKLALDPYFVMRPR